jgi:HlyD family secretion protein
MKPSFLLRRVLPALILVAVVVGGFLWATRAKPVVVVLKTVDRGNVESTVGRIEFLGVKEGDKVKKGQLLLKLWNDDQKAQQTLAEAQRASSMQRVKEVCTTAASSLREAERQTSLRARGYVSEAREDAARSDADARRAACDTARADIVQADARIRVTKAEQGRMALYAPFDGTVAKIVGELGEYSTPSPPGVATPPAIDLIDDTCLYVKAPMDEVDAPKIKAGLPVRVSLDALPKQPLAGKVRRVAPYVSAVEKQARTVDVEVDFEMPASGGLLVGYSADVEIVLGGRQNVLRVPTAALVEGGRVMVLNADSGKLEERKVKTGIANWEFTEIVDGLAEGERIVISLEREGVKVGARATADEKSK